MSDQTSRIAIDAIDDGLSVAGVVDSHTAGQLMAAIQSTRTGQDLGLDLSAVEFIDSSGLRILVNAHREMEEAGNRLVLVRASDAVIRLLDITGLADHLHTR